MRRIINLSIIPLTIILFGTIWYVLFNDKPTNDEPSKVIIGGLPNAQGLPVYMAIEKGYFRDAGLDVELVNFESPNQIVDSLLQGQIDLSHPGGPMGIAGIADYKNPGKMKIYAVSGGDDSIIQNDAILVKNNSPLQFIHDLRGKKLGIMAGSIQWQTIARELLDKNNLIYGQDVEIIEIAFGLHAQALASGDIDASLVIEPIPTVVKARDIGTELTPFASAKFIANPFYAGAGIIGVDFSDNNPDATKKVMGAIARAINDIRDNPDASRQYLKRYTQLDETTISKAPIVLFKMYSDLNQKDIDETQKFYDIFTRWGVVDGTMDFTQLIYSPN